MWPGKGVLARVSRPAASSRRQQWYSPSDPRRRGGCPADRGITEAPLGTGGPKRWPPCSSSPKFRRPPSPRALQGWTYTLAAATQERPARHCVCPHHTVGVASQFNGAARLLPDYFSILALLQQPGAWRATSLSRATRKGTPVLLSGRCANHRVLPQVNLWVHPSFRMVP